MSQSPGEGRDVSAGNQIRNKTLTHVLRCDLDPLYSDDFESFIAVLHLVLGQSLWLGLEMDRLGATGATW
jgi:hypothetical protein